MAMVRGPPGPKSLRFDASICGVHTDFVVTDFGSHLFVVVTQNAKIGCLVEASASEELRDGGDRVYEVRTVFGDRRAEHHRLYARALIELIAKQSSKLLLLGIALKEHSPEAFKQTMRELEQRIVSDAEPAEDSDEELLRQRRSGEAN